MIFDIGIYRLDIDIEATARFYGKDAAIGCDCAGCRNFEEAVHVFPAETEEFLRQFGIDPGKPAEISVLHSPDGRDTLYNGFYHICGTILEGTEPWVKVAEKHYRLDERYGIERPSDFFFFFRSDCYLLEPDFPRPAIQLEFAGTLPWLLEEPNPYT